MRIVLDGRTLLSRMPRGTGKAFREVYRRLAAVRPDWEIAVVHRSGGGSSDPFAGAANVTAPVLRLRGDRLNLWQSLALPWQAWSAEAAVLHCPANTGPRWAATPILVTIHDLIPIQPEFQGNGWKEWARRVGRVARRARYITTPSEFSRRQIIEAFDVPDEKVVAIPWAGSAFGDSADSASEGDALRGKYGIAKGQPYALAFGAEDPRKNTRRILEAWARLAPAGRNGAALLVVGLQERFREELSRSGLAEADAVHLHGYIPEEDVPQLLRGAEFLCFPTLYEGFGLPVLDAFACGSAVLTSRNSSIPEVAGEAAVYVDPRSSESIAAGMAELLGDPRLRSDLVAAGREQLKKFSWDRCAAQYADVIQKFA